MIIFFLTFLVNFLVLYFVLDVVFLFLPPEWDWVDQILLYLKVTPDNVPMMTTAVVAATLLFTTTVISYLPFMQSLLCYLNGCRRPSAEEKALLEKIVEKLCYHSGKDHKKYNLYVKNDNEFNAFAIGTNNICVHRGLLYNFSAAEVAGIIAHEMGHIENRDTTYSIGTYAMSSATQIVLSLYLFAVQILSFLIFVPFIGWFIALFTWFVRIQMLLIEFLLSIPLHLVTMFGSRQQEYAADKYAYDIGLGRELHAALSRLGQIYGEEKQSGFSSLWSTHPEVTKRLIKLEDYLAVKG